MPEYIIYCRYQYNTSEGVDWTKWYPHDVRHRTKEDAEAVMNSLNENVKDIDKKTKLKHEFLVKESTEFDEHVKEINERKSNRKKRKK